jgi:hypothetical protein
METINKNGDQLPTKENHCDQLEIEQINNTSMKKKKSSRGMHMFSVVMFMLRRRRGENPSTPGSGGESLSPYVNSVSKLR